MARSGERVAFHNPLAAPNYRTSDCADVININCKVVNFSNVGLLYKVNHHARGTTAIGSGRRWARVEHRALRCNHVQVPEAAQERCQNLSQHSAIAVRAADVASRSICRESPLKMTPYSSPAFSLLT